MILNTNTVTVSSIGDIQENNVSIDPKNIEHIVTILSSNLYSNPEESFLRETISNAYDSHIEAGTKDPIILSIIEKTFGDYSISIRDYGTGISPERFKEIYLCIGSSTKRADNQYIGAFGIGRFSALACSNMVHITSYYNGKAYYYLMMKNGSKINIDNVSITDTEEKNGVEVRIDNIQDLTKYRNALKSLYYFKTLYIHTNTDYYDIQNFNTREIIVKDNFCIDNGYKPSWYDCYAKLVLGNVIYNYDLSKTYFKSNNDAQLLSDITLKFNIGDLDITPNREALLYSDKTISALNNKIKSAYDELRNYAKTLLNHFDDILSYWYTLTNNNYLNIGEYCLNIKALGVACNTSYNNIPCFVYKGDVWSVLSSLASSTISSIKAIKMVICNGHILDSNDRVKSILADTLLNKNGSKKNFKFLVVPNTTKFRSSLLREYLSNKYANDIVIILTAPSNISTYMVRTDDKYLYSTYLDIPYLHYIKNSKDLLTFINELKRFIKKYGETVDIENSDSYKQYCESQKSTPRIPNTTCVKTIRFYCTYFKDYSEYNYKVDCKSLDNLKSREKWMFKEHKIVIFGSLDNKLWDLFRLFYPSNQKNNNYVLVKVANSNFNKIKELPNGWLRVEDLINAQNPHFINIITIHKYKSTLTYDYEYLWDRLRKLAVVLPHTDKELVLSALKYRYSYNVNTSYYEALNLLIPEYKKLGSRCNSDIIDSFKCANKYLNILIKIQKWFNVVTNIDFIAFLAMKHKLFRINYTTYKYVKDSLNLIEDENS